MTTDCWVLVILSLPLFYILIILTGKQPTTTESFSYGDKVSVSDMLSTSVAYALQVAAFILFVDWGAKYGFAVVIVPIFWFLGHLLLIFSWKKFSKIAQGKTLHAALSNNSVGLRLTLSLITLIALAGSAMTEVFYVSDLFAQTSNISASIIFIFFITISVVYIIHSGFQGVVNLDKYQIAIAVLSLMVALWCVYVYGKPTDVTGYLWYSLLFILIAFLLIIIAKLYLHLKTNSRVSDLGAWIEWLAIIVAVSTIGIILVMNPNQNENNVTDYIIELSDLNFYNIILVLGLLFANTLYQFVDISQWQRLEALKLGNKGSDNILNSSMKVYIITSGFIGSMTWFIAIVIGVMFHVVLNDSNASIIDVYESMKESGFYLSYLFIVSILLSLTAVGFSTLDSMISATALTLQKDVLGIQDNDENRLL